MIELLANGTLVFHSIDTINRVVVGFGLGSFLGAFSGIIIGWNRKLRAFFDILIDFLRNVSAITLIPITILLLGIGFKQKIAIIAFATYFPVVLNTINGVSSTEKSKIDALRAMQASNYEILRHVVLPSASPSIFTGLRISASIAFIVVIAAEMVGATSGLGYYMLQSERVYQTTNMFATALLISILGYISNKALLKAGEKALSWKKHTVNTL